MQPAGQIIAYDADKPAQVSMQDTALPYIDQHLEQIPQMKEYVNKLIEEEMSRFSPPDYLAHLPKPSCEFSDRPAIRTELERIAAEQPFKQIDTARYRVEPPPADQQGDPAAWSASVSNAMAQSAHQEVRLENLELLQAYGPSQLRVQNAELDTIKDGMSRQQQAIQHKTEDINKARKIEQMQAGERLQTLENKWQQLVYNNRQIEAACENLEREVKRLKESGPEAMDVAS